MRSVHRHENRLPLLLVRLLVMRLVREQLRLLRHGRRQAAIARGRRDRAAAAAGAHRRAQAGQEARAGTWQAEDLVGRRQGGQHLIDGNQTVRVDSVFLADGRQLGAKDVILLGQLQHSTLQYHVVEAAFLPGAFSCLVVASSPVPVAVVFLVVRNEFALLPLLVAVVVAIVVVLLLLLLIVVLQVVHEADGHQTGEVHADRQIGRAETGDGGCNGGGGLKGGGSLLHGSVVMREAVDVLLRISRGAGALRFAGHAMLLDHHGALLVGALVVGRRLMLEVSAAALLLQLLLLLNVLRMVVRMALSHHIATLRKKTTRKNAIGLEPIAKANHVRLGVYFKESNENLVIGFATILYQPEAQKRVLTIADW